MDITGSSGICSKELTQVVKVLPQMMHLKSNLCIVGVIFFHSTSIPIIINLPFSLFMMGIAKARDAFQK